MFYWYLNSVYVGFFYGLSSVQTAWESLFINICSVESTSINIVMCLFDFIYYLVKTTEGLLIYWQTESVKIFFLNK